MTTSHTSIFFSRLKNFKRSYQSGLSVVVLIQTFTLFIGVLTAYVLLDFFLAFPMPVRIYTGIILLAFVVCFLFYKMLVIWRLPDRKAAILADWRTASRRCEILAAFELCREQSRQTGLANEMGAFLTDKAAGNAAGILKSADFKINVPLAEIAKRFKQLGLMLIPLLLLSGLNARAMLTIGQRIFTPLSDIPPYSRYEFKISPEQPQTIYGKDIDISVTITGKPVNSRVWFVVRRDGKVSRTPCFQTDKNAFSQRIANPVTPVSFCFYTKRARSHWHELHIALQPRINEVMVQVTPPDYSRLPVRQFSLNEGRIDGLAGASLSLTAVSNRPLSHGRILIKPLNASLPQKVIEGRSTGSNSLLFSWELRQDADLSLEVFDTRETRNHGDYVLHQRVVEDRLPEAVITEPAAFVMATPGISVPISIRAEDDHHLKSVNLIRSFPWYRDRIKRLGPERPVESLHTSLELDLAQLGVEPGQTFSFNVEVRDYNPTLLGVNFSNTVSIQIVSNEDYAAMIRSRDSVDKFIKRFRMISEIIHETEALTRNMIDALDAGNMPEDRLNDLLGSLRDQNIKAAEILDRLAKDFPVYDIEEQVFPKLARIKNQLIEHRALLADLTPRSSDLAEIVRKILNDISNSSRTVSTDIKDAEEIEKIARVMACATRFQAIYKEQVSIVDRFDYYLSKRQDDLPLLNIISLRQKDNQTGLAALVTDIENRALDLPENKANMTIQKQALAFAQAIKTLHIVKDMTHATSQSRVHNAPEAFRSARQALEKMGGLFSEGLPAGMNIDDPRSCFSVVREELQTSLSQMLSSFLSMAVAGNANDGYFMGGKLSPLNVPVYGPSRTDFGAGEQMNGNATAVTGGLYRYEDKTDASAVEQDRSRKNLLIRKVPEKYQKALEEYFGNNLEKAQ